MRSVKHFILTTLVTQVLAGSCFSQKISPPNFKSQHKLANIRYEELEKILSSPENDTASISKVPSIRAVAISLKERKFLKYRNLGLKFWKEFPSDPRRHNWFYFTCVLGQYMHYWKNPEAASFIYVNCPREYSTYQADIDEKAVNEWKIVYPQLRKEYMKYIAKNFSGEYYYLLENRVYVTEVESFFEMSLNLAFRNSLKVNLNNIREPLMKAFRIYNEEVKNRMSQGRIKVTLNSRLLSNYTDLGLTDKDMITFFESFRDDPKFELAEWANKNLSLFRLKEEPIQIRHMATNGRKIDLKKLQGKVVLLDFWSLTCSSCIDRMPAIKQVYDKYKDIGFAVVSVCVSREDEMDRIERVEKMIGADWPLLVIGGKDKSDVANSLAYEIFNKYGFAGVPQLLLLDKNGKLVLFNDVLRNGDFEPQVKKLLQEKN